MSYIVSDFDKIINEFSQIETVSAIVLGGSSSSGCADERSDKDVYIYSQAPVHIEVRTCIAQKYSKDSELDNKFFEDGDEMILNDDETTLDLMYRNPQWIEGMIDNVWEKHYASMGYTTCFLHNVASSKILHDPQGWFASLQKKISGEYPQELIDNILKKNLPMLKEKKYSSYYDQIKKALERKDYVSLNHRISAFFASYFDVLFALNKMFHPGEKRLVQYVLNKCQIIPTDFEKDVNAVLCTDNELLLQKLNILLLHLYEVIQTAESN